MKTARTEKMEFGLWLTKKGHRNIYEGQNKTFETSFKTKIALYFPRSDDNITDNKYSYPRAAIHTARILAKEMFKKRMFSALGMSIE